MCEIARPDIRASGHCPVVWSEQCGDLPDDRAFDVGRTC